MKKNLLKSSFLSVAIAAMCLLTSCGGEGSGRAEFDAAEEQAVVTVETYIQAKFPLNSWGSTNIYAQDKDGGYYVYRYYCDQAKFDTLTIGQKVKITGTKASWAGEVEFGESHDTVIDVLDGKWVASPKNLTATVGNDEEMIKYQNCLVEFKNVTVLEHDEGKNNGFAYKGDTEGDDIYIKLKCPNGTIECCVEVDFTNSESTVYKTAQSLKVGDKVTLQGFLNWYDMPNPHVSSIVKK